MILGYRLRQLRKNNNMSQAQLGKLLGVTKVSISGYEKGTRVPSMNILVMILNVFNVSADYLLGRELNVICEGDDKITFTVSKQDINIISELKNKPLLYNKIAVDPKRFFSIINNNFC